MNKDSGKYGKISEAGHRGSSRGHKERSWRGLIDRETSRSSATASNVPEDNSNFQHRAGAFPGDVMQD